MKKDRNAIVFTIRDLLLSIFAVIVISTLLGSLIFHAGEKYGKNKMKESIKKAIMSGKNCEVEGFQFFSSIQNKRYISYEIKNVAEITIVGASGEGRVIMK